MEKPKGTKDYFGATQKIREFLVSFLSKTALKYGFNGIETPIFEYEEVFRRSIGDFSDIVSKEMYSFQDKKNRQFVLRPEGTAPVVRAVIENRLYTKLPLKLFYYGPMFRYENPQKNRQRQFSQFGLEIIGSKTPFSDLEIILFGIEVLNYLDIDFTLKINSLGDASTKAKYAKALQVYLANYQDELSEISKARLANNPLRILDDKLEQAKHFMKSIPPIDQFYSADSKKYLKTIIDYLTNHEINFELDNALVRGLDYYSEITFEFVSNDLEGKAQNTLIGGGRYEKLMEELDGPSESGVGLAIGVERIFNEIVNKPFINDLVKNQIDIFIANITTELSGHFYVLEVVQMLRDSNFSVEWNYEGLKLHKAFEKSSKHDAKILLIIGDQEAENQSVNVKHEKSQITVPFQELATHLKNMNKN